MKSLRFVTTLALVFGFLLMAQPKVALADAQLCGVPTGPQSWWGDETTSPNTSRVGVHAALQGGGIGLCQGVSSDDTSIWVALYPRSGTPDEIVQIGIYQDRYYMNDTGRRYGFAFGGCNGVGPTWHDLGAYPGGQHDFKVLEGASAFYFYIDGTSVRNLGFNDPSVSCWYNQNLGAFVYGERHDDGGTFGTVSQNTQSGAWGMQFKTSISGSQPWYDFGHSYCITASTGTPSRNIPTCYKPSTTSFQLWD